MTIFGKASKFSELGKVFTVRHPNAKENITKELVNLQTNKGIEYAEQITYSDLKNVLVVLDKILSENLLTKFVLEHEGWLSVIVEGQLVDTKLLIPEEYKNSVQSFCKLIGLDEHCTFGKFWNKAFSLNKPYGLVSEYVANQVLPDGIKDTKDNNELFAKLSDMLNPYFKINLEQEYIINQIEATCKSDNDLF